jgi:hypothetical protein
MYVCVAARKGHGWSLLATLAAIKPMKKKPQSQFTKDNKACDHLNVCTNCQWDVANTASIQHLLPHQNSLTHGSHYGNTLQTGLTPELQDKLLL